MKQHDRVPGEWGDCQKLYGLDVMVDQNFQPWLLEINRAAGTNHGFFPFIAPFVENLFTLIRAAVPLEYERSVDTQEALAAAHSAFHRVAGRQATVQEARLLAKLNAQYSRRGSFELVYPHLRTEHKDVDPDSQSIMSSEQAVLLALHSLITGGGQ